MRRDDRAHIARREEKPEEAKRFELSMRGTYPDLEVMKLYTDRVELEVGKTVSFDNAYEGVTSVSYFLASLLSSVLETAVREMKREGMPLDEIEGIVHAELINPLRMVPVRGYDAPPELEHIRIKLFYYGDDDEETMTEAIKRAQKANPIYRLIERAAKTTLEVEYVL